MNAKSKILLGITVAIALCIVAVLTVDKASSQQSMAEVEVNKELSNGAKELFEREYGEETIFAEYEKLFFKEL